MRAVRGTGVSNVLQCVAVCCSVLHCVALCCTVLHCVALCCTVLQCVAVLTEYDAGVARDRCAKKNPKSQLHTPCFSQ